MCLRAIVFRGHKNETDSILVTQLFAGLESVTQLLDGECSLRTMSNLDNLHVVRGLLNNDTKRLDFQSSMTGPHHYFGYMDPYQWHSIDIIHNSFNHYKVVVKPCHAPKASIMVNTMPLPSMMTCKLSKDNYRWESHTLSSDSDLSVFASPGSFTLMLHDKQIHIPTIHKPEDFDWRSFNAQLIAPNQPFAFEQTSVQSHEAAQHRLRLITYHYGYNYFSDFCVPHKSDFLERHDFVQFVHSLDKNNGGYMVLGRKNAHGDLQLVKFVIPYGYTLLLDVGCIHGDARLVGLYLMGMTGNHNAMSTADTVFFRNVSVDRGSCNGSKESFFEPLMTHDKQDCESLMKQLNAKQNIMYTEAHHKRPFASMFWIPFLTDPFRTFQHVLPTNDFQRLQKRTHIPLSSSFL